jgi:hypothetical protein
VIDSAHVPPVAAAELLSRFVLFTAHVRSSDNTVKQDAFMPHPRVELSLTRHLEATDAELWQEGERVAAIRARPLYGRAVVPASAFVDEGLSVEAKPIIPENPNHADAVNWPVEKAAQKMKALQIAAKSTYISKPN